ncbi:hypothetical protein COCMIDRAFT_28795 [Bipolaris oryzae ATCC 44560]|uniref:Uncharacterized protein n=1 Tax=Bipolaris oryzae ATCC 44560 TaxID=930090 RepID=W6YT28_COCMI|nr:uncharacterized protein COCMIDRAFT_28795 [Bipolaris oryzae ATCC 44560]EUC42612.1 hypothetical protein COCMIDRAFT_28795 [Bipolaris oryzae ATCC 44560]
MARLAYWGTGSVSTNVIPCFTKHAHATGTRDRLHPKGNWAGITLPSFRGFGVVQAKVPENRVTENIFLGSEVVGKTGFCEHVNAKPVQTRWHSLPLAVSDATKLSNAAMQPRLRPCMTLLQAFVALTLDIHDLFTVPVNRDH